MSLGHTFSPREAFLPPVPGYQLLPFRFLRWSDQEVFVSNEVGEFLFLPSATFDQWVAGKLCRDDASYQELKARHFLADNPHDPSARVPLELLATKARTRRAFLAGFTKLHLFVVTLRCDHTCRYCQVSRANIGDPRFDMTQATAEKAVELMFGSPSPVLKVEFQGGEPLLAFERIQEIVAATLARNAREEVPRDIEFVVATNLAPLTDEMLEFFRAHQVLLSTSLDGPAALHDANRPRPGRDSHAITLRQLDRARGVLGEDRVAAVMTTTARSLQQPREIVDEYVQRGFRSIFLRPISPYGFAVRTGEAWRYETDQFLEFYRQALGHIIELNRQGISMVEVFSQILLTKILTPFTPGYVDLQSPAGAGIGAVAYNYDGDVYAADEARMLAAMGDTSFRLGNVHRDSWQQIFGGETLRALVYGSVLEALPGCAECAFLPFCGADPIFHHRTQGDLIGHRPTSAFCRRHMGMLRHLLERLRGPDPFVPALFTSWVAPPALAG